MIGNFYFGIYQIRSEIFQNSQV